MRCASLVPGWPLFWAVSLAPNHARAGKNAGMRVAGGSIDEHGDQRHLAAHHSCVGPLGPSLENRTGPEGFPSGPALFSVCFSGATSTGGIGPPS